MHKTGEMESVTMGQALITSDPLLSAAPVGTQPQPEPCLGASLKLN